MKNISLQQNVNFLEIEKKIFLLSAESQIPIFILYIFLLILELYFNFI